MTSLSNVTTAYFNVAGKSRDSTPWRVELVFESSSLSTLASVQRGRGRMEACHVRVASRAVCRQWKAVRYRQYDGRGRRYCIFDATAALAAMWSFCYPQTCRFHSCSSIFLCLHQCRRHNVSYLAVHPSFHLQGVYNFSKYWKSPGIWHPFWKYWNLLEFNCSSWNFLCNSSSINNWREWHPVIKSSYWNWL